MRSKQEIRGTVDDFVKSGMTRAGVLREAQRRDTDPGLLARHSKKQAEAGRGHSGEAGHRTRSRAGQDGA
jgi:hypothetical protein